MGVFKVTIEVGDPAGQRFESVDAVVDTGATYSVIPATMLRSLDIESIERGSFDLADGTLREFELGETRVRVHGTEVNTVVVFGDEHTEPLLGAYTLERLRLAVDPARQRLISVPGRLMLSSRLPARGSTRDRGFVVRGPSPFVATVVTTRCDRSPYRGAAPRGRAPSRRPAGSSPVWR